jgi:putative FmdB family regulatory protein
MPLYPYRCEKCGTIMEVLRPMKHEKPECCGGLMTRLFNTDNLIIKMGYPGWIDKIDDINKAQEQRGERLRLPHPKTVGATDY